MTFSLYNHTFRIGKAFRDFPEINNMLPASCIERETGVKTDPYSGSFSLVVAGRNGFIPLVFLFVLGFFIFVYFRLLRLFHMLLFLVDLR